MRHSFEVFERIHGVEEWQKRANHHVNQQKGAFNIYDLFPTFFILPSCSRKSRGSVQVLGDFCPTQFQVEHMLGVQLLKSKGAFHADCSSVCSMELSSTS